MKIKRKEDVNSLKVFLHVLNFSFRCRYTANGGKNLCRISLVQDLTGAGLRWIYGSSNDDKTRLVSRTDMKTNGDYGELTSFFITFEESQQEHGRRWVMLGAPNPSLYMSFKVWISYSPLQNDRKESTPHVIWTPNLSIFGFLRLFKITFKIFAPTTVAYTIFSYTKNGYVRVSIAFICKYFVYKTVVCAKMEEDGTW